MILVTVDGCFVSSRFHPNPGSFHERNSDVKKGSFDHHYLNKSQCESTYLFYLKNKNCFGFLYYSNFSQTHTVANFVFHYISLYFHYISCFFLYLDHLALILEILII